MTQVRRANVVLTIKDDQVQRYLDMGYDVLDATGAVVKTSVPKDVNTLKMAFVAHEAEIEKLKVELQAAQERIAVLEKPKKTAKQSESKRDE